MAVIEITEANFETEVLKSDVPVLVDFWAVWCGPCQMQGPIIDELAEEVQGVKFGKLNVDENMGLAQKFRVMSLRPCSVQGWTGRSHGRRSAVQRSCKESAGSLRWHTT